MKKCLYVVALTIGVISLATFHTASQTTRGPATRNLRPYGLNPEQRARIKDAVQDSEEMAALADKLAAAHAEALKVALSENAAEAAVREKVEAVAKIQTEISMLRYRVGVKPVLASLSDEQRSQVLDGTGGAYDQLFTGTVFTSVISRGGQVRASSQPK